MFDSHYLGHRSEQGAEQWFLKNRPAKLLARNYRWKGGEIDLIFEECVEETGWELVFLEVRARTEGGGRCQDGIESVSPLKRYRIEQTAERFLQSYKGPAQAMRFDILAWNGRSWTHLKQAWR